MSLRPVSTSDRKDAEMPVSRATSPSDRRREVRRERSRAPTNSCWVIDTAAPYRSDDLQLRASACRRRSARAAAAGHLLVGRAGGDEVGHDARDRRRHHQAAAVEAGGDHEAVVAVDRPDHGLAVGRDVVEALDEDREGDVLEDRQQGADAGADVGVPDLLVLAGARCRRRGRWPARTRRPAAWRRSGARARRRAARAGARGSGRCRRGSAARARSAARCPAAPAAPGCPRRRRRPRWRPARSSPSRSSRRQPSPSRARRARRRGRRTSRPRAWRCRRTRRRRPADGRSSRPGRTTRRRRSRRGRGPRRASTASAGVTARDGMPRRFCRASRLSWASSSASLGGDEQIAAGGQVGVDLRREVLVDGRVEGVRLARHAAGDLGAPLLAHARRAGWPWRRNRSRVRRRP